MYGREKIILLAHWYPLLSGREKILARSICETRVDGLSLYREVTNVSTVILAATMLVFDSKLSFSLCVRVLLLGCV